MSLGFEYLGSEEVADLRARSVESNFYDDVHRAIQLEIVCPAVKRTNWWVVADLLEIEWDASDCAFKGLSEDRVEGLLDARTAG